MFCPACGEQVNEGAKFCFRCGNPITTVPPTSGPAHTPAGPGTVSGGGTISGGGTVVSGPRPTDPVQPGERFADRYRVERALGRGGMGTVYLAEDLWANRPVCLKVILPELIADEALARRFLREGTQARDLRHRNIVAVYDVSRHADTFFLSMEYVEGRSLRDWLRENLRGRREVSLETSLRITRQILDGLREAHRKGVVHRDLKPENLMLCGDPNRSDLVVKILDFGIARALDSEENLTIPGATMGTPVYMAPEQETAADAAGPEADLYSAGVIFYEILTGIPPRGRWSLPTEVRPDLSAALDEVLLKALQSHPARRFATAADFRSALDAVTAGPSRPQPPPPVRPQPTPPQPQPQPQPTPTPRPAVGATGERALPLETQGMDQERRATGTFDVLHLGMVPLSAAMDLVAEMPAPPPGKDVGDFCDPSVLFPTTQSISRVADGRYFLYPEETFTDVRGAQQHAGTIYATSPAADSPDARIPMWTQGISKTGRSNGDFEPWEHGPVTLEAAIQAVEHLPHLPDRRDQSEYCPPTVGFETGLAISRAWPGEAGELFLFPQDRYGDLDDARRVVKALFRSRFG